MQKQALYLVDEKYLRTQGESTEIVFKFRQESHLGRKVENRSSLDSGVQDLLWEKSAAEEDRSGGG